MLQQVDTGFMDFSNRPLGRNTKNQDEHIKKYPLTALLPQTVATVNKVLRLPKWHKEWDQGQEGACVGYGTSMMMSVINHHRYFPEWLWIRARLTDGWDGNDDLSVDEGTWVNSACEVLRTEGHELYGHDTPDINEGVKTYRWATSVDQMRTGLSQGMPISIGIDWYDNFDRPKRKATQYWIGEGDLGDIRGGHCVCVYGASDKHQAFRIKNSWGGEYPLVWLPYETMQTLLDDQGEAALITDR